jgi:hypothetical protein
MSRSVSSIVGLLALALSVGACEASSNGGATPAGTAPGTEAPAPQATPLTASGAPEAVPIAVDADGSLMSAASVVRIDWVADNGAKMFGTAGGDPAANGLYTYIAFFTDPGGEWVIYELGNFLDYTVLSSSVGRVDLDIHESTIDEATGEIDSRHRKVIVSWTPGIDGGPPTGVMVTPAQ